MNHRVFSTDPRLSAVLSESTGPSLPRRDAASPDMDFDPEQDSAITPTGALSSDEAIRSRVIEFLGGRDLASATSVHLGLCDCPNPARIERRPLDELDHLLARGEGISRSLYDTHSILVHLDVEYVNHDAPAAAFTDPWRAYRLQEPLVSKIEELLSGWGIRPLHLLSGQGHHFVWRFPRGSELERRLKHLVPATGCEGSERIFANLALVMEYFAHRIKALAEPETAIPVEITASHVVPGESGQRELISIDISEYGDPLGSRTIRIPFTRYRKPWSSGIAKRHGVEEEIGPCVCIPLHEMDVMQALTLRQDAGGVLALARRCCMLIPEEGEGTGNLLDEYLASTLRAFHQRFYETDHDPPESWPHTYARTPLHDLPGCARHILTFPNDLLLKPSGMRLITRCLTGRGWHPRHIAGLIRSKFEDPVFQWGDIWRGYSPSMRADFYVRLYSGLLATGLDRLADFHCDAARSQGFCWPAEPPCELRSFLPGPEDTDAPSS